MALTTQDENLIESIPELLDRVSLLESTGIVVTPNMAYLASLDPLGGTLVISDAERLWLQELETKISANIDILAAISSAPSTTILTVDNITAIDNITATADKMLNPRLYESVYDAHLIDTVEILANGIHHTHPNKSVLQLITDAGSTQIITNAERTMLNTIASDYTTLTQFNTHVNSITEVNPAGIHHTHTNKVMLDAINIDTIEANETNKFIKLGKLMIHYGVYSYISLPLNPGVRTGVISIPFSETFLSPPTIYMSIGDTSAAKDGGLYGIDINTTNTFAEVTLTNLSGRTLFTTTLNLYWSAIGQWIA